MTYAEAQDYLFTLRTIGSKFGLERMHALYEAAGRPGCGLPLVHVAGTNGKGSVCAMVEAAVRANGYKTGMFTSPHLLRLGERVQVNRVALDEQSIVRYVTELKPLAQAIAAGNPAEHPTFFELMTVMALLHFERENCDVAIIETGLGGRLDSTNILQPLVTAITSIGLDHQEILGDTLSAIAREKAGIIKRGVPVVLGRLPREAEDCICAVAGKLGVEVLRADDFFCDVDANDNSTCHNRTNDNGTGDGSVGEEGSAKGGYASGGSGSASGDSNAAANLAVNAVANPVGNVAVSAAANTAEAPAVSAGVFPLAATDLTSLFALAAAGVPVASGVHVAADFDGTAVAFGHVAAGVDAADAVTGIAGRRLRGVYPHTSLAGGFQRRNAGVAMLICAVLARRLPMDAAKVFGGLLQVQWAGRWQSLRLNDGRELILDASHNEEGAHALEENLQKFIAAGNPRPVVVTGALGRARASALLAVVARYAVAIYLVEVGQPRACGTQELRELIPANFSGSVHTATVETLFPGGNRVGESITLASGQSLLVTGSIYLIGEVLTQLHGISPVEATLLQDKLP